MASAAASRPPAPPPPPPPPPPSAAMQWLAPRVSFSLDDAGGGREASMAAGAGKASADFEFFLAGCSAVSTMLPADQLFSGGKLVPLRIPATSSSGSTADGVATRPPLAPAAAQEQPETPRAEEVEATKDAAESTAEVEPKVVPARRWRDLLRMRKQQASSSSSSSSSTSTDTKPLRRLLRRGPKPPEQEPSLNHPLLRDPEEPEKLPSPAPTATPTPSPPPPTQPHHQQLPPKIRLTASQAPPPPPPPPPPAVAADSPRLNAAGKVVFNGLGRSSSSPSSLAGGRRHRAGSGGGGGMERSYSAHVRVTPVLNVPVCRKSVSVFGIDRLFSPSSASTAAAAHAAAKKGKVAKKEAVAAAPPPPPSSQKLVVDGRT